MNEQHGEYQIFYNNLMFNYFLIVQTLTKYIFSDTFLW